MAEPHPRPCLAGRRSPAGPDLAKLAVCALLLLLATGCGGSGSTSPDGTPPTVTTRTPTPGESNVAVSAPIEAFFSEPIAPGSLTDTSVVVSGESGALLARTLGLSGDGKTLSVDLISSPALPNTITVTLTDGVTDSTGTPLAPPTDDWSFALPEWLELGGALSAHIESTHASEASMALNSGANPVVAWAEFEGATSNIHVRQWDGSTWSQLGDTLSANDGMTGATRPSLDLDAVGNPVVAWHETDGSTLNIYVQRWTGSAWSPLGSGLSANAGATPAFHPSLKLDGSDFPVVAWHEEDGSANKTRNIHVWRWSGSDWAPVGTGLLSAVIGDTDAIEPSLELDESGNPVVAWSEYDGAVINIHVWRWDGAAWDAVGGQLSANVVAAPDTTHAFEASLALDGSGDPVVAWRESDGIRDDIYVRRWTGSTWSPVGTGRLSDGTAHSLHPSLALTGSGDPVVAWDEVDGTTNGIFVRRWDGSSWTVVGSEFLSAVDGETPAAEPSLAIDGSGAVVVSWHEGESLNADIYVRRENR